MECAECGLRDDDWFLCKRKPCRRSVPIRADVLETVLQLNGAGLSLTGDIICDIRRALGERP